MPGDGHDAGLPLAGFQAGVEQRGITVHEHATTPARAVAHDPVSPAVGPEQQAWRTARLCCAPHFPSPMLARTGSLPPSGICLVWRQFGSSVHDPEKWVPVFGTDHAQTTRR